MTLHENYQHDDKLTGSSNRGFGLVFAVVFAILAVSMAWHGNSWWVLSLVLSAAAATMAFLFPERLALVNRGWTWIALQLAKITTPVVLLLLFVVCFLPMGLIMRILGKDFLRLKRASSPSYWMARDGRAGEQTSMKNQF